MRQLYTPKMMNVFVFFSGGASSMRAMLANPNHGKIYRVVGAYTDRENAGGRDLCRHHAIDDIYVSRKKFYAERGLDPAAAGAREQFYEALACDIEPFEPDVIALCGYMHIVTEPLLSEYVVLNVHPADLAILSGPELDRFDASSNYPDFVREFSQEHKLSRKFKGEDAVYDALAACEPELRSTVHIATADFDEGPIVTQSRPFFVNGSKRIEDMRGYANELQEKMKREGDGPAYTKALELIAKGRLGIEDDTLFLDGNPLHYCGYRIDG